MISIFFWEKQGFFDEDDPVCFFVEEKVVTLLFLETFFAMFGIVFTHADGRGVIYKFIL